MASLKLNLWLLSSVVVGSTAYGISTLNQGPLENLSNETVFAKGEAFVVMPVSGSISGVISEFGISPDSRFIHAIRYDGSQAKPENLWNRNSQRRTAPHYLEFLDRERQQTFRVLDLKNFVPAFKIEWTSEPGVLILETHTPTKLPSGEDDTIVSIWRISALDRSARELVRIPPALGRSDGMMGVSANGRYFFTLTNEYTMAGQRQTFNRLIIRKLDLQGKQVGEAVSPNPSYEFSFLADGETPVLHSAFRMPATDGATEVRRTEMVVDFAKRVAVQTDSAEIKYWNNKEESPLTFAKSPHLLQKGNQKARINALWLEAVDESERPRAFLDVNPSQNVEPQVAPDLSCVAYVVNGSLQVRPLLKMTMEAYKRAEEDAIKAMAISQAKQMGTAINIYMADYDDYLPLSLGFKDSVMPYVKNESLFDGFVYTRPDGNGNAIELDPTKTIIGYIQTPFGRAVVRLDSSVVWEPNKP